MFFKIIDRYIFKELLKLFIISTGALTTILYLDKFLFMAQKYWKMAGVDKKIEKLDLEFEPKLPNQQKMSLTFYDEDECFALNGEVPLINKWAQILNLEMEKAV